MPETRVQFPIEAQIFFGWLSLIWPTVTFGGQCDLPAIEGWGHTFSWRSACNSGQLSLWSCGTMLARNARDYGLIPCWGTHFFLTAVTNFTHIYFWLPMLEAWGHSFACKGEVAFVVLLYNTRDCNFIEAHIFFRRLSPTRPIVTFIWWCLPWMISKKAIQNDHQFCERSFILSKIVSESIVLLRCNSIYGEIRAFSKHLLFWNHWKNW